MFSKPLWGDENPQPQSWRWLEAGPSSLFFMFGLTLNTKGGFHQLGEQAQLHDLLPRFEINESWRSDWPQWENLSLRN